MVILWVSINSLRRKFKRSKTLSKWGIDPERNICCLGVMVKGSGQMGELLGRRRRRRRRVTWKFRSETVLVFGPESVSYERSRLIRRCILREISARAFFGKINKNHISNNSRISGKWEKRISNISRKGELRKKYVFQYFQDYRECCRPQFPIFPGGE